MGIEGRIQVGILGAMLVVLAFIRCLYWDLRREIRKMKKSSQEQNED